MRTLSIGWCLLAALLFGASTPLAKALLGSVDPVSLAGLFYLGAALGVAWPALRERALAQRPGARSLGRIAFSVFAGGVVAPVLVLVALSRAAAADVSIWLSLETAFTMLLARAFFHENLSARSALAGALILLAGVVLAWRGGAALDLRTLLVVLACLGWALDNNLTAVISEVTPAQLTMIKGLVAGVTNLALGAARSRGLPSLTPAVLALAVGALSYGGSLVLYIRGARVLGAARAQILFATAPVVGAVLAWLALHEQVHAAQLGALGLVAGGLASLLFERHGHLHTHEAMVHTHEHRHDDGHHDHTHPGLAPGTVHSHPHTHDARTHAHSHEPDLHHRHGHPG